MNAVVPSAGVTEHTLSLTSDIPPSNLDEVVPSEPNMESSLSPLNKSAGDGEPRCSERLKEKTGSFSDSLGIFIV